MIKKMINRNFKSQAAVQVLQLCRQAGLVKLGYVALDGTKVRAAGCSGLAFRVQDAASTSCCAFMLQMELSRSAQATAGQPVDAFHLLAKVQNDQIVTWRRRYVGEIPWGEWVQMQVRTEGDLLQAAIQLDFSAALCSLMISLAIVRRARS